MEKKTIVPEIAEQITEIRLPASTTEFQKLILGYVAEICELKNRILLQAYSFTDKQLKPATERFNSDIGEFACNLSDAMDNLMTVYVILEEIRADRTSKFITGKEADNES